MKIKKEDIKKKFSRVRILSLFNLLLGIFFLYMSLPLITSGFGSLPSFGYFIFWLLILALGLLNLFFFYKLVFEHPSERLIRISGYVFFVIVLILATFFGILIASISGGELLIFGIPILFCFIFFPYSKKMAILFMSLALLLGVVSFFSGFEESYCWTKGDEATAKYGSLPVPATARERKDDPGITDISPGWRAHLACHRNFNFQKAFKEEVSF